MAEARLLRRRYGAATAAVRGSELTRRLPSRVMTAALVSAAATVAVVLVPEVRFAYRAPQLHVALETAAALIGLLAAFLVFGRFRRNGLLGDLMLCYSLGLLACSNLLFAAIPSVVTGGSHFSTWARLFGQLIGAVIFAAAAFAPQWRLRLTPGRAVAALLLVPAVLGIVAVVVALFRSHLPAGVELTAPSGDARRPRLEGSATLLTAQLVAVGLYLAAAIGFDAKARRTRDELMKWLAVAAVFGAFARLNYFLYPSLYTEWVYSGDFFRLAFYVAILTAAAREISSYWETLSHTAVLEERRRMARDLHDGLAQELAYIGRNLRGLDDDDESVARVKASADRALSESRRAIAALTKPLDEPLDVALAEAARETADREGTTVDLVLAPGLDVDYRKRDTLIRIACEATANAARHGQARLVRIELVGKRRRVRLRVSDDGSGFDPAAAALRPPGYGLISMRERAHAAGGTFDVRSRPGSGTSIEVVL